MVAPSPASARVARNPIPRSRIAVAVVPADRAEIHRLARRRVVAIDFFTSHRCGVTLGDLTVRLLDGALPPRFVALASLDGLRLAVHRRLVELLERAGPSLHVDGPPFARRLTVRLDDPAAWIGFLETPAALRPD